MISCLWMTINQIIQWPYNFHICLFFGQITLYQNIKIYQNFRQNYLEQLSNCTTLHIRKKTPHTHCIPKCRVVLRSKLIRTASSCAHCIRIIIMHTPQQGFFSLTSAYKVTEQALEWLWLNFSKDVNKSKIIYITV